MSSSTGWCSFESSGDFFSFSSNSWSGSNVLKTSSNKSFINGVGNFLVSKSFDKLSRGLSSSSSERRLNVNNNFRSGWFRWGSVSFVSGVSGVSGVR
jgi:hypothetical protein